MFHACPFVFQVVIVKGSNVVMIKQIEILF